MALACINVDLDSIPHYCRIHGQSPQDLSEASRACVYRVALGRLGELFAEIGISATFFAVGEDLSDPASAEALAAQARAGHEIGNHSFSHDYALSRRGPRRIGEELDRAQEAIAAVVGAKPVGFRAPGYTLSAPLIQALVERGFTYDSSAFPAAPYYAAKAGVMGALRALGRRSSAILDRPRVLLAPRLPYRPSLDEPYARGDAALLEIPVAVEPYTRVPFIGSFVTLLPEKAVSAAYFTLKRERFLNLELHGIELLDDSDVQSPPLAKARRDLRVSVSVKRNRLKSLLWRIAGDFEVVTLAAAARRPDLQG